MSNYYPMHDRGWEKENPRTWTVHIPRPDRVWPDVVRITLRRPQCWQLIINNLPVAELPTWDEAASLAPMLYQLHKDQS